MLRPRQPTLGALVLVCEEPVHAFGDVSAAAYADLAPTTRRVEAVRARKEGVGLIDEMARISKDYAHREEAEDSPDKDPAERKRLRDARKKDRDAEVIDAYRKHGQAAPAWLNKD